MQHHKAPRVLTDTKQNFWVLTSIQVGIIGLPGFLVGNLLADTFGIGVAFPSILLGNFIIWLIGLSILGMRSNIRDNALQNIQYYLGDVGAYVAAIFFVASFLCWYSLQLESGLNTIENFFSAHGLSLQKEEIRYGAALGILTTFAAMKGIKPIKWLNLIILPVQILFVLFFFPFFESLAVVFTTSWHLSLPAILLVVTFFLSAMINLPTYFRHSKTKADSILSLSITILFVILFETSSIAMQNGGFSSLFKPHASSFFFIVGFAFIFLLTVSSNMANIYYSSACWELVAKQYSDTKQYAIIGLLGTSIYTFLQAGPVISLFTDIVVSIIGVLTIVMVLGFLTKLFFRHRPRTPEKIVNNICWIVGAIAAILFQLYFSAKSSEGILIGTIACVLTYIFIIFFEETYWAAKTLVLRKSKHQ